MCSATPLGFQSPTYLRPRAMDMLRVAALLGKTWPQIDLMARMLEMLGCQKPGSLCKNSMMMDNHSVVSTLEMSFLRMQGFSWQVNQLTSDIECSRSVGFRMFDRNCSFGHV